jgi:hypothetical protein
MNAAIMLAKTPGARLIKLDTMSNTTHPVAKPLGENDVSVSPTASSL